MSPLQARRLVGLPDELRELSFTNGDTDIKWVAADEIDRLKTALRAVRASTDPRWQAQIISDALREKT
jgi:hypothetical protein